MSVELQSGESLTCTSDHPFIVLKGGEITNRAADGLEPGDWVCVPKRVPTARTDGGAKSRASLSEQKLPANQPEALGAILGYIAGDGNIFYNRSEGTYGIRFTNKEEELLNHFESVCVDAFGKEPSRPPSEQRSDGVQTVRLSGKWIVDELFELGTNNENYDGKVIPEGVSEGPRSMQAGFIRALADSEATVGDRAVKICSSSRGLLLGTKMLLLEFNISSQIVHRKRSTKRDIYELNITSKESIERFQQHIGFTLTRKNERLAAACGNVHGTRTILDVIPGMGDVLREIRNGLRLYVSEAGASHSSTYCNFENGDANLSIRLGRSICQRFNQRKRTAEEDLLVIRGKPSWEELEEIRQRYHISQKEISDQLPVSQQYVSEHWGTDANLRDAVEEVLSSIVKNVAAVNIDPLEKLVNADVKWRKVTKIEEEAPSMSDPRVKILRHELCELLGYKDVDTIEGHAKQLLSFDPNDVSTWDELRETLKKHQISFADLAQRLDVVGSTVSRWFNGVVDVGNFEEVKQIALELIETKRKRMTKLLNEINDRRKPKVYDLTVEGTHNYLANGMVVHNSEDRSAMHEALEQQSVSVSKAGINATLQARCALLGAANPTYGRFDQYEPIAEQIDLEPALVSRFDLIFTVDDLPDQERDERIAEHILRTNYAGELSSRQAIEVDGSAVAELEDVSEHVTPPIEPERLRTYVAYATQRCIPTMTEEARQAIKDFYLDLRAEGVDEDSPIPMTARKLEALVRLAEASARIRLADEVTREDAERVIELVRASMGDIGFDPETGTYDVDMIETGTPKTQRDRIRTLKGLIESLEDDFEDGIPLETIVEQATERGLAADRVEHELEKMKQTGEIYEPSGGRFRLA
ncbi:MAG: LAGLIDADG family homing endonuclease [Halobacteriota archaeon]